MGQTNYPAPPIFCNGNPTSLNLRGTRGQFAYDESDSYKQYVWAPDGAWHALGGSSGSGDVVGPAGAVSSSLAVFDGPTGTLIKDSISESSSVTWNNDPLFGLIVGFVSTPASGEGTAALSAANTVIPTDNGGRSAALDIRQDIDATSAFDVYQSAGLQINVANNSNHDVTLMYGVTLSVSNNQAGDVEDAYGLSAAVYNTGSGDIEDVYALYLFQSVNIGAGSIENAYGLFIEDFSASGSVLSYNIWSDGPGKNHFTGGIEIGTASHLIKSTVNLNDGAGASLGTLTNAPAVGDPTKWIPIDDNGTTRYVPSW